ncbi:hypothetical protein L228DRAFT_243855 [Xylona heveae TC161]|uniref:EF-hand domain-containing protein n=1 Tax=Xylona heveae (strain CBS 132557 / TC161) TaxID=1328760 RepID=A0A165ILL6_XYLHT|nr:hypothetical protein L228DRAFT_243855 [Xylona heveae TC161]KZF25071.1 hypothetical protein L228DRAFT_243855 [Xylona heveae TC161]
MSNATPYRPSPLSYGSQHRTSPFRRANSPASPSPLRPSTLPPSSPTKPTVASSPPKPSTPSHSPTKMSAVEFGGSSNRNSWTAGLGTPPMPMSPPKQPSPPSPLSSPSKPSSPDKSSSAQSLELPPAFGTRRNSETLAPRAPSPAPPSPTPSRPGSSASMGLGLDRENTLGHARTISQERSSNSPFIAQDRRNSTHSLFATTGATQDRLASSPFVSQDREREHERRGSNSATPAAAAALAAATAPAAAPTPFASSPFRLTSSSSSSIKPQNQPPVRTQKGNTSAPTSSLGNANPAQAREMREAFQLLDRDGDGQVTRDDVIDMLTNLGQTCTPADLAPFFPPNSNSTTLNLPSFLNTLTSLLSPLSDPLELENAFAAFDDDDSGQIDAAELRDALLHTSLEAGESPLSEREVDQVLASFAARRAFAKASSTTTTKRGPAANRAQVFKYLDFMNTVRGSAPNMEGDAEVVA